jgi:hypothetical protein
MTGGQTSQVPNLHEAKAKLLVFVIAYCAEATLRRVLERIPASVFKRCACEVLVLDDASTDRSFEIGRKYQRSHPEIRMTVRNEFNQGYGGNQRIGYTYAIAHKFDFVAMGARRRPVCARRIAAAARTALARRGRRRVWQQNAAALRGVEGRYAALQVCRQQGDHVAKGATRHPAI